ncbi:uncharacterized protein LOC122246579 [Penaeus japonicus]|uniref:uncharacterized protein LOC122246579 n=1 Tax=Penaeus japonicus TaxID=27405 RepID=UPI001C70D6CE|nr:uncharacterized protein LOC122246579 [Penaeus japonicus]
MNVAGLHVAAGIDVANLKPLPDVNLVNLTIDEVTERTADWACRVVRSLQPAKRGYFSLAFPSVLREEGTYERLLEGLACGVNVTGAVRASPPVAQEEQKDLDDLTRRTLDCFFSVLGDDELWGQKPLDVQRAFNFQRYTDNF